MLRFLIVFMLFCGTASAQTIGPSSSAAPSGAASGGLKGSYPGPSLADINAIATSLAIGGATIGTNALAITGSVSVSTSETVPVLLMPVTTAPTVPSGSAAFYTVRGTSGAGFCSLIYQTATTTQVVAANIAGTGC